MRYIHHYISFHFWGLTKLFKPTLRRLSWAKLSTVLEGPLAADAFNDFRRIWQNDCVITDTWLYLFMDVSKIYLERNCFTKFRASSEQCLSVKMALKLTLVSILHWNKQWSEYVVDMVFIDILYFTIIFLLLISHVASDQYKLFLN